MQRHDTAFSFPTVTALVTIRNLHFLRGDRVIFAGINMEVPRGKITAIMGPSGTGKTTLLKLIAGQLSADQGEIWVDGQNIDQLSSRELYALRTRMGMLFQSGALLTDLTVFDNVAYPLREHTRLPESMIRKLVLMKLEAVGLRGARELMPAELSGGMARRVALARAMALDPMMIMYDEPFAGQDPISMGVIIDLIKRLNDAAHLTSLLVSHDVQETLSIADHVCVISGGKIIEAGTPAQLKASTNPWTRQFIHAESDGPVPFHLQAPNRHVDFLGDSL